MFTESDVKSVFALYPPLQSSDFLPSLIRSDAGHGFVTLQFVQAQFRSRVTRETRRLPVSDLASELDVHQTFVLQLARNHPKLALISSDSTTIITLHERDALQEKLSQLLDHGMVLRAEFATQNRLHSDSLQNLLREHTHHILTLDDYIYTKAYEDCILENLSRLLQESLNDVKAVDITPKSLPGSPTMSFILQIFYQTLESKNFSAKFAVHESNSAISCIPTSLTVSKRDAVVKELQTGALIYLDLYDFMSEFPELFPTYDHVQNLFDNMPEVEVLERCAVSRVWVKRLEEDCIRILQQEGCSLDISGMVGSRLPDLIRSQVASQVETTVTTTFSQTLGSSIARVGPFLLTETRRDAAVFELTSYAVNDADAQWAELSANPRHDLRFSITRISAQIPDTHCMDTYLIREKAVEKQLDEQFWKRISHHESQNESEFAAFWRDRVLCRLSVYNTSLTYVTDEKLRDQLYILLMAHVHQELIPDALTKARAQNFVLSRRTQKNTSRLDSVLRSSTTNATSALDKFAHKQAIPPPSPLDLASMKTNMMEDMRRRMLKLKCADGPALFLMLVILLFAEHCDGGIIYATGKFAPKLLRLLNGKVDGATYAKLAAWKEAAKVGTLVEADKEGMVALLAEP